MRSLRVRARSDTGSSYFFSPVPRRTNWAPRSRMSGSASIRMSNPFCAVTLETYPIRGRSGSEGRPASFCRAALSARFFSTDDFEYFWATKASFAGFQTSTSRSEEHTSELQSPYDLVCRLLLEKNNFVRIEAEVC